MQALCEPEQREIDNNDVARGRDARRYLSGAWLALIYRGDVPPGDRVTNAAMAPRMPEYDDPLYVEYRQVVARKAASKSRPIQINPVRRVRKKPTNHNSEPDRDGLTLNLLDLLPYLPVAWLAYRCARDGLVILLRNKNKNEKLCSKPFAIP
ncbi:hypothetical protein LNP17_03675 [Klebsiella variicola subsp. variicola]|nr:hypothetical protein [Klebsiella variicola subsp. variicola]